MFSSDLIFWNTYYLDHYYHQGDENMLDFRKGKELNPRAENEFLLWVKKKMIQRECDFCEMEIQNK